MSSNLLEPQKKMGSVKPVNFSDCLEALTHQNVFIQIGSLAINSRYPGHDTSATFIGKNIVWDEKGWEVESL